MYEKLVWLKLTIFNLNPRISQSLISLTDSACCSNCNSISKKVIVLKSKLAMSACWNEEKLYHSGKPSQLWLLGNLIYFWNWFFFPNSALSKRTLQWFFCLLHCCSSDNDNIDASNSILPQNVTVCHHFSCFANSRKKLCAALKTKKTKIKEKRNHFSLIKTQENRNTI